MHEETKIRLTPHAIERYCERFGEASKNSILASVMASVPASERTVKYLRANPNREHSTRHRGRWKGYLATVSEEQRFKYGSGPLFLLKQIGVGEFVLITVLDRKCVERDRKRTHG